MTIRRRLPSQQKTKLASREAWGKLYTVMDENDFSIQDFCACICYNLWRYADVNYTTMINIRGQDFLIRIDKCCGERRFIKKKSINKILKNRKKKEKK